VPSRRLDDRIRELCARITAAPPEQMHPLVKELQSAIREKIQTIRNLAVSKLLGGNDRHRDERRSLRHTDDEHSNGNHASS
jgi:hypothetical protein